MSNAPILDFVLFYVSDLEESLKYFTETLGLEHDPTQDAPVFRGFVGSPIGLALANGTVSPEPRKPGDIEVYFKPDNLEEMHAALMAKGVPTSAIAHLPFGSIFRTPAPDGHLITLIHQSAQ